MVTVFETILLNDVLFLVIWFTQSWCLDWSLLDTLTWPVYLVHYLMVMGYTNGLEWKGFYAHSLERDYYTLSAGRKLLILQILCDDVLDSEELRAEMDMREESEVGIDIDSSTMISPTGGSRRVHPRYSRTASAKDKESVGSIAEHHEKKICLVVILIKWVDQSKILVKKMVMVMNAESVAWMDCCFAAMVAHHHTTRDA
ncbi:UNVERIFIED_CONTAM: DDT domain-containing protein PTM [Sesamum radiatum]|uniref:DDT domain-containing protein PTM n=1 Tax=Sesamum radiatum TaxID=300843 RepID=A0AAW2UJU0_SESRA